MNAMEWQRNEATVEELFLPRYPNQDNEFDDDAGVKRTGTLLTASAHIITAVLGIGVLSLSWSMAQLGWIAGPIAILAFAFITSFCSILLIDCYRSPDPILGKRNHTYMDCVRANLGGVNCNLSGVAQYVALIGLTIGYAITTATSIVAIKKSNCFHENGHDASCHVSLNAYMIMFGCIEIVLSQLPNFHKISGLSILAAIMAFSYALIGLGLAIAKIAEKGEVRSSLTRVTVGVDVTEGEKVWRVFQAIGNIACAFPFSMVLIEIQDTLRSGSPGNQVMKKASIIGVSITTTFYILCAICGYAAFGNDAPGNLLTGFGFYEPFWLIDIGNIFIVIHLVGAYQVFSQPLFQFVEKWSCDRLPHNYIMIEHNINVPFLGDYSWSFFRLIWRTGYVIMTTLISMIFPFFNTILGLIGGLVFWPLTIHFPIEMYIVQAKIRRFTTKWFCLKILSFGCLMVSVIAVVGSIQGLAHDFVKYKLFKS